MTFLLRYEQAKARPKRGDDSLGRMFGMQAIRLLHWMARKIPLERPRSGSYFTHSNPKSLFL
jgi:hypothetical protein